ncbi:glycosyltransferase [Gilvibacter sp.]|uniref:glycosyltransferase n=1 Tax=Gilvibacter sp. TaxID=2729997 RepID=UPI003F49F2E5
MSLKVLFWLKEFPKFSETFIRDQIVELIRSGHEVHIYTLKRNGGQLEALKGLEDLALFENAQSPGILMPASKIDRFKAIRRVLSGSSNKEEKKLLLRSLNGLKYGRSALNGNLFFLLNYLFSHNINIIHTHYGTMGEQAAQLKALGYQGKLFCTFHGFDLRGALAGRTGFNFPLLKQYAHGIFAISKYSEEQLLGLGFSTTQVRYLPNGIKVFPSKETRSSQDPLRILSVGRLVPEKDYETAFKALSTLAQLKPDLNWQYTLVGHGELAQDLKDLVHELKLTDMVEFKGALASEEVQKSYQAADLFLLSSKVEVLPTVLLEALNAGLTCVSTDVGAVAEILGSDAYLSPPQQPEALCATLLEAIENQQQWAEKIIKQRHHLASTYEKSKVTKQLIAYYTS